MPRDANLRQLAPLELYFMLCDSVMHLLSPKSWKVVSFVARMNLQQAHEEWEWSNNPLRLQQRDLAHFSNDPSTPGPPASQSAIDTVDREFPKHYREPSKETLDDIEQEFASLAKGRGESEIANHKWKRGKSKPIAPPVASKWWSALSLREISDGIRESNRRFTTCGTALPKTSAVEGIDEAIRAGILERRQRKTAKGRDLPSQYSINWTKVLSLETHRRKRRTKPELAWCEEYGSGWDPSRRGVRCRG